MQYMQQNMLIVLGAREDPATPIHQSQDPGTFALRADVEEGPKSSADNLLVRDFTNPSCARSKRVDLIPFRPIPC